MAGRARPARLALLALVAVLLASAGALARPQSAAALPAWTGGMDLYRSGSFTTQQTWRWCTAADVQLVRNLVRHESDQLARRASSAITRTCAPTTGTRSRRPTASTPRAGRPACGSSSTAATGVIVSGTFSAALRSAVTNLRRTHRPVGLLVAHGNHAWVLTGFTATADPAVTSRFTVTSVRVTGPLWGLQSRTYGYDMRPDKKLTPSQLHDFLTPLALRRDPDGLGGPLRDDPAGRGRIAGRAAADCLRWARCDGPPRATLLSAWLAPSSSSAPAPPPRLRRLAAGPNRAGHGAPASAPPSEPPSNPVETATPASPGRRRTAGRPGPPGKPHRDDVQAHRRAAAGQWGRPPDLPGGAGRHQRARPPASASTASRTACVRRRRTTASRA